MMNDYIVCPWQEWTVKQKIGEGGFGKVYKIQKNNSSVPEYAAMKVITIPESSDETDGYYKSGYDNETIARKYGQELERILNEYKFMRSLKGHPNIVSCEEEKVEPLNDRFGWRVYIRMEYLTPLEEKLAGVNITEKQVIKIGRDICEALMICENRNIIHRDIKPDNILVSVNDTYKLGDFGIARIMDHTTKATRAGTQGFIAPEIYKMEPYGKSVDTYSLGLVLYWMLNDWTLPFLPLERIPTSDEVAQAFAMRIKGTPLPSPLTGCEKLKNVILKACSYNSRDRYQSAYEMQMALKDAELYVQSEYSQKQRSSTSFRSSWDDLSGTIGKQNNKNAENKRKGKTDRTGEAVRKTATNSKSTKQTNNNASKSTDENIIRVRSIPGTICSTMGWILFGIGVLWFILGRLDIGTAGICAGVGIVLFLLGYLLTNFKVKKVNRLIREGKYKK